MLVGPTPNKAGMEKINRDGGEGGGHFILPTQIRDEDELSTLYLVLVPDPLIRGLRCYAQTLDGSSFRYSN